MNYTLLALPDLKKPFLLRTDASGAAMGAVLYQQRKPVVFSSKAFTDCENRYSTYDQELLAVVRALERWRHLLLEAKVDVDSDHHAIR